MKKTKRRIGRPVGPEAVSNARADMEAAACDLRDVILACEPRQLLSYLWSQLWLRQMTQPAAERGQLPAYSETQPILVAMEYVHAVWSCYLRENGRAQEHGDAVFQQVMSCAERLAAATTWYIMVSTSPGQATIRGTDAGMTLFQSKSSWASMRGNRHVMLEGEFFSFVLAPHDDALVDSYGMRATALAEEIQAFTLKMLGYAADASAAIETEMEKVAAAAEAQGLTFEDALSRLKSQDLDFAAKSRSAVEDLLFGEHCSVAKHSGLPVDMTRDLSFEQGENTEFFAPGELCGTPLRTLPARIKPFILFGGDPYVTDPYFFRDSLYRALQKALIARNPSYREEWNRRQKNLSERAFPSILGKQLPGASVHCGLFYPGLAPGRWFEIDCLIVIDDVLIVIEAKAGGFTLQSPDTDHDAHLRTIERLIGEAFDQCARVLEYLASDGEVPLYEREAGAYVVRRRLRLTDYRMVIPIGLTLESFTPFSSMCKQMAEFRPMLGKHPFVSLSVDDLFVLRRLLPTGGDLLHYLEVRQAAANVKKAFVYDEMDHLGSYIKLNRYDRIQIEKLGRKGNLLAWDGYSQEIDAYFGGWDLKPAEPPRQKLPEPLAQVLSILETTGKTGWAEANSHLRNLSGDAREAFAQKLEYAKESLGEQRLRAFHVTDESIPLTVVVTRRSTGCSAEELVASGRAGAFALRRDRQCVLVAVLDDAGRSLAEAFVLSAMAPSPEDPDYRTVVAHAESILESVLRFRSAGQTALRADGDRKIGRNERCWCGSGKKFKKCHGAH
jgi:hypothetical protein